MILLSTYLQLLELTNWRYCYKIVNATSKQVIIDDITWTGYTGAASPSLNISAPADATVYPPNTTNVNVSMSVLNFSVDTPSNGDGYIVYNINGGGAVDKFDTTDISVPVTEGQSYTVNMELVDNSGNSLSTPVTASVSFSVDSYTVVTSISQIRTDVIANGTGKFYHLNSEAIVTYARPLANRNQKYIQDATAAILIDDNGGVITNTFNIGDGMTGFKGQTSSFSGVLQIIPTEDIAPNAPGFSITPEVVTVDDLVNDMTNNNYETYESELVKINGVTFADGNGSNTFAVNTNYDITDTNTMTFRSMFAEADYVVNADLIPAGTTDIIVLAARFNTTPQVVARDLADMPLETKSFDAIDGLTMYPNPVTGNTLYLESTANASKQVQVYDVLGKQVINTTVNNNSLNVANLNAGVYIVKITEEGKTATRKLVVK
ncbi:MAG: T9SS type A sorting domain-containing protein [Flavobacterium haoranii]